MDKPVLTPDFTVEDIRKLRDYNSSRHINMPFEEIQAELKESVKEFERLMKNVKDKKQLTTI